MLIRKVDFINSDDDLLPDKYEIDNRLNPRNYQDKYSDYDKDGLNAIGEYLNGTNPNLKDTDNDTMYDGYEVKYNLNPLNATDKELDYGTYGFELLLFN